MQALEVWCRYTGSLMMHNSVLCFLLAVNLVVFIDCAKSVFSEEDDQTEEIEASKCSEQYENCGVIYETINVTDSTIINATTGEHYDEFIQKTVKVNGYCCDGLVCKHEGYEEEPLPAGVTHWCADPEDEINRERMFDKWKQSLEMPPNYS